MKPFFVINKDHYLVIEPNEKGLTGHYVLLKSPEKLREPRVRHWVGRAESSEELQFRIWVSSVKFIYNETYRLNGERPRDHGRIYHLLQTFPGEIWEKIEDYWAKYGKLARLPN